MLTLLAYCSYIVDTKTYSMCIKTEDWLSTWQCIQVCNEYLLGVVFSYECGAAIADNSTCCGVIQYKLVISGSFK